ncbi:DDE-type integrase/transposase/recombinase [uncultured Azonexus sp.]|uniref:DDE-type integrase/transposase/recombinase n=1 Tax=uncultured Azonexus sp. TaxID=520307 RepID=UPI00260513D2|nr:DDE-type integrase/transposase/recombinase [uncultured Azonexus sp.]
MRRISFKIGLIFIAAAIRYMIRRRLVTGKLQLESDTGELINLTDAELLQRWQSGEWVIDESSLGSLANAIYLAVPRDLGTYPESQQSEAIRRRHYLQAVDPDSSPYKPDVWRERIAEVATKLEDRYPPCPSTVQSWWRRYRLTKSISCLIPHNKPSSGPKAKRRYQVFEEVIASVYLSNQQLPKLAVAEEVFRRIDGFNRGLPAEEQIKRPARSTIYRWLESLQQDLVDASREGAEAARIKYRAAIGNVKVACVLERIEIDHTPLDLIVIDTLTKLPLGRPWLTMAIDVHSRMVVGFYVSFNAPSGHGVLQCLRRAILPKEAWLARFPDIKGTWPAYGIPDLIAVDNGTDLHSGALEAACMEMGIQILFCGAKTPQHKGAIERFFRTMNMGLIHRLPGTVFSNVDQRGDYPSEDKAVIDMATLVHLLTKWIVDVYNVSVHRGIGARPIDHWSESAARRIIELPVYPQQLEVITGIPAKRTLFHYGIELDGLQYNSDLLQAIRRRAGENRPVQLKYYENTVEHIHVFDPYAEEYINVPAKLMEYAESLPRDIHRLVREHARKRYGDHCLSPQLLEARAEIEALVKQALKDKRMGSRKAGAGYLMHDSESVLRGEDPLQAAMRPRKLTKENPPSELPGGLDDDLPDFDVGEA